MHSTFDKIREMNSEQYSRFIENIDLIKKIHFNEGLEDLKEGRKFVLREITLNDIDSAVRFCPAHFGRSKFECLCNCICENCTSYQTGNKTYRLS